MANEVIDRVVARIRKGKGFVVSSHVRLDGDGIASALAMDLLLRGLGKESRVVTPGPIPHAFRFLPGAGSATNLDESPGAPLPKNLDTLIVVDVADAGRLGGVLKLLPEDIFTVLIDHHKTGDLAADIECSDPEASATGELIRRIARIGGFTVTPDVATNIYTAIMTDTQRFSLPNTTPAALRIAAEMMELGADPGRIGDGVYRSFLPGQIALWGEVAQEVRLDRSGRLAWASLTEEMLKRHGVHPDDTQDFADIPRTLLGVEVGVLFRECASGAGVRVSLRSNRVSVLSVAERFGGGGHALACGCELDGTLDEVQALVLDALREVLGKAED
jgi:phosphoesterase RecJ-like protein